MSVSRVSMLSLALLTAPALFACRQNPLVKRANPLPRAVITPSATKIDAGGTVMLNATASTDDGAIVQYRWLSATRNPDGKTTGRYVPPTVPENERASWPPDGPIVTATLPEGWWVFTLWVTDDLGSTSDPTSIAIQVGSPTGPSPLGGSGGSASPVGGNMAVGGSGGGGSGGTGGGGSGGS